MMDVGFIAEARSHIEKYGIAGNLSWVRTAAQAALAIQLHGVLETTGYQSASAKLQHASLPKFSKVGAYTTHDGNTDDVNKQEESTESSVDFEEGIVCVESNLEDTSNYDNIHGRGYDMLPSPLPLPERSALCAGSLLPTIASNATSSSMNIMNNLSKSNEVGVHYGDVSAGKGSKSLALGDVSVDKDIERLRDIIVTVDKSLGKALSSGLCVGAESNDKISVQIDLLKAIDHGDSWRGKLISQKELLHGIESLERNLQESVIATNYFISGKFEIY